LPEARAAAFRTKTSLRCARIGGRRRKIHELL
jgi:hypothetical protein